MYGYVVSVIVGRGAQRGPKIVETRNWCSFVEMSEEKTVESRLCACGTQTTSQEWPAATGPTSWAVGACGTQKKWPAATGPTAWAVEANGGRHCYFLVETSRLVPLLTPLGSKLTETGSGRRHLVFLVETNRLVPLMTPLGSKLTKLGNGRHFGPNWSQNAKFPKTP